MRVVLEALMYLAFSAAALPMAWLGVTDLLYFHAHPEMLEVRDAASVVPAVFFAIKLMVPTLALAAVVALYFIVAGPRRERINSGVLVLAWVSMFPAAFILDTPTPFASMARLYWDTIPFFLLGLLPWPLAWLRFTLKINERAAV